MQSGARHCQLLRQEAALETRICCGCVFGVTPVVQVCLILRVAASAREGVPLRHLYSCRLRCTIITRYTRHTNSFTVEQWSCPVLAGCGHGDPRVVAAPPRPRDCHGPATPPPPRPRHGTDKAGHFLQYLETPHKQQIIYLKIACKNL